MAKIASNQSFPVGATLQSWVNDGEEMIFVRYEVFFNDLLWWGKGTDSDIVAVAVSYWKKLWTAVFVSHTLLWCESLYIGVNKGMPGN